MTADTAAQAKPADVEGLSAGDEQAGDGLSRYDYERVEHHANPILRYANRIPKSCISSLPWHLPSAAFKARCCQQFQGGPEVISPFTVQIHQLVAELGDSWPR